MSIVDHFTRESLAIEIGQRMRGRDVVTALERLACERELPESIRVDNGPEFTSKVLDQWAYANGVTLDFSGPGKPTDNAFIESFNGSVRAECLNENWFLSLDDAKEKIDPIAFWATWPPKISLHLAGRSRPDEALIFSLPLYQERGAGQVRSILRQPIAHQQQILIF